MNSIKLQTLILTRRKGGKCQCFKSFSLPGPNKLQTSSKLMKPGTKSRKLGLEIPTVNPCNDFIVDYLIRNKIKSDKQVLCKSYLYNLAIEAVRKYPLPLICEEQLAALEGFGNFFIGQVGRLIKKHYNRGRLPTEKQMEEDDQAHFEALRAKKRPLETPLGKIYSNLERDLDSPAFGPRTSQIKRKFYRPKKNTEPFHILQALVKLGANKRAVTKGDINQALFEEGKQKIRLWYLLRQKLQEFQFISLDQKNEEYIYLTEKGLKYVQDYDNNEEERALRGRKKAKQSEESESEEEQKKQSGIGSEGVKKMEESDEEEEQKTTLGKSKSKGSSTKQMESKLSRVMNEMRIKKNGFSKSIKSEPVLLLINEDDCDLERMENCQDLNYDFCHINLANFLWSVQGKILDYIVVRIKQDEFDVEKFKTFCFRAKMTTCEHIYVILEKSSKQTKVEQRNEMKEAEEEDKQEMKETGSWKQQPLLCRAIASGIKIIKSRNLDQTIEFVKAFSQLIKQKIARPEEAKRSKEKINGAEEEDIMNYGSLDAFNKRVEYPYQLSTIMGQILRCIPELSERSIKLILEKYPTLAIMHKKTLDLASTKDKKQQLEYELNHKISDSDSLNLLVQLLYYEAY